MILIIGGANQGKKAFGYDLLNLANKTVENNAESDCCADGSTASYQMTLTKPLIDHFEEYVKRLQQDQLDPMIFTKKVFSENPTVVIVMTEMGCGIVPVAKEERKYRQTVGQIGQYLASQAQEVYRIVCGIGIRIK